MKKLLLLLFTISSVWQSNAQLKEEQITSGESSCWKTIASGAFHNLAIREDGTLWGWGKNYGGGLTNLPENVQTPTQLGTDNTWVAISCGNAHTIALKSDGTIWGWGRNDAGQVGIGISPQQIFEITQIGTDSDWVFINAGGGLSSAAIKTDGTLWTWGFVNTGETLEIEEQGGDTSSLYINTPTQMGTDTNWKYIDIGHYHTAAIKKDGTLWSWGLNYQGQLGLGNNTNVYIPAQTGTDTDWEMVKASNVMTAAIKKDGTLWTWGENTDGSLGNGITTSYQTNIPIKISDESWRSVDLGMNYFCGAIKEDGSLWTWGSNLYGSVGNGTIEYVDTPYMISSKEEWAQYSGGGDYSVALKKDGTLLTWGYNWHHQLGFNLEGNTVLTPVAVDSCARTTNVDKHTLSTISVYPNPATTTLNLANANDLNIEKLTVIDVTGKTLLEQKSNTSQIDIQQLPAGMYFLEITANGTKQHTKFIKE